MVFVPTMGNLHAGHVSLIEAARKHGKRFVASIFVNPMQFGPNEDFAHYPRTPTQDAKMLSEAGCDLMFSPEVGEIYPNGADQATRVEVPGISNILCGEFRPGHFEGVATVVAKLFHIVDPDVAIFGEKDFQQLTVIRRMVADLCLRVEIVGAPTVRESRRARDELAQPVPRPRTQRKLAPTIYRQLQQAVTALQSGRARFRAHRGHRARRARRRRIPHRLLQRARRAHARAGAAGYATLRGADRVAPRQGAAHRQPAVQRRPDQLAEVVSPQSRVRRPRCACSAQRPLHVLAHQR